jgi:hypothetical protein
LSRFFFESINERPTKKATTFTKNLESKEEWLQQLLFKWIAVAEEAELYDKLQSEKTIRLVSDGGFHRVKGSFGCVIDCDGTELMTVAGKATGKDDLNSSFLCDAYGMLAGLCLLKHIQLYLQYEPHTD